MRKRLHPDAVPYAPTIERLNQTFLPKPGDLFTHEQLRALIQPHSENRYRGILAAWKRDVKRRSNYRLSGQGRARGIGIMCCDNNERSDLAISDTRAGFKKVKRSSKEFSYVDTTGFTQEQLTRHNISQRWAMAIEGVKKTREPPTPGPAWPGNMRKE
jgi:hypothetical protein